jgi:hypothetical protein
MNDNTLTSAIEGDDFSFIDLRGQRETIFYPLILGAGCYASCEPHPIEKSPWKVFIFL